MNLINQSFEILRQEGFDLPAIKKQIERCGRTSYKSENKITESSYIDFYKMLINNHHYSPLEFGEVYLKIPKPEQSFKVPILLNNHWTQFDNNDDYWFFSTNMRVIVENKLESILQYLCVPCKYHSKRMTVKFITNRAVTHELVRHRDNMSFIQESQRYCNYSKDKFGNEVTFIKPSWIDIPTGNYELYEDDDSLEGLDVYHIDNDKNPLIDLTLAEKAFIRSCDNAEQDYFSAIKNGWKPQQARVVLPNSCKTEICVCGTPDAWKHLFKLRDSVNADPQMRDLIHPLHNIVGYVYK